MRTSYKIALPALLLTHLFLHAVEYTTPYFSPRSQNEDAARWLVGWTHQVNRWCVDKKYLTFAITPIYSQSFKSYDIAETLFGDDLKVEGFQTPYITISGSAVPGRYTIREWFADYFGLPPDFQSNVFFKPHLKNIMVDFNFYLGFNDWADGAYINVFGPLVYTQWSLGMHEKVINTGSLGYDAGYFNATGVPRSNLLNSFTEFIAEGKAPFIDSQTTFVPLQNSKMSTKPLSKIGFADIQVVLGYNFIQDEDYHIGGNLRGVIPTGTIPKGEFLFEPIIGNGHFFEAGVGLSTHGIIWRDADYTQEIAFYLEVWFTHMFPTRQVRAFDLKVGDNSRYMLAQNMTDIITGGLSNKAAVEPDYQFNSIFNPVANLTTLSAQVAVAWQADIALLFNYTYHNLELDLGFDYWTRQAESIKSVGKGSRNPLNSQNWALKGDSHDFGYREDTHEAVALSATQSNASIHEGENVVFSDSSQAKQAINNLGVDNAVEAWAALGTVELLNSKFNSQINTSFQPVLLANKSIAHCRSSTQGLSYGFFANLNYVWNRENYWYTPYLGGGGKIEISPDGPSNTCPSVCTANSVPNSLCGFCDEDVKLQANASQWTLWLKGGMRFN